MVLGWYLMLWFSSTDRDGTETPELWLGRADWEDEVGPTICDDQVGSNNNITVETIGSF